MHKKFLAFSCVAVFLLAGFFSQTVFAAYITYPGDVGVTDETNNDCSLGSYGLESVGNACTLRVYFQIPSGSTLRSITVYYYDNSGSQSVDMDLMRSTLASDSSSTLVSASDTSTSASIQYSTLSYGSSLSSSYSYYIEITLDDGAAYRGMKVYY